jgi:hypothetical protein
LGQAMLTLAEVGRAGVQFACLLLLVVADKPHSELAFWGDALHSRQMVSTQRSANNGGLAHLGIGPHHSGQQVESGGFLKRRPLLGSPGSFSWRASSWSETGKCLNISKTTIFKTTLSSVLRHTQRSAAHAAVYLGVASASSGLRRIPPQSL